MDAVRATIKFALATGRLDIKLLHAHSKSVIHCDILPRNLLLHKNLDLKTCRVSGKHLSVDGEVLLNGFSCGPSKFSCPRDLPDYADVKTDIFALGSTIYFIMVGHDV
jgi:serine/threonine protein kinase